MKKLTIALSVLALVFGIAGISAANTDVNLYGSSAIFKYMTAATSAFVQAAPLNCPAPSTLIVDTTSSTAVAPNAFDGNPAGVYYHGAKYFIAQTNCGGTIGLLSIRVAAYDSMDGINAVLGNTNPVDVGQCAGNQRTMLVAAPANGGANNVNNFGCYAITLGDSDVNGLSLIQNTEGSFDGPTPTPSGSATGQGWPLGTFGDSLIVLNGPNAGVLGAAGPQINADLGDFYAGPAGSENAAQTKGPDYVVGPVKTCGAGTGLTDNHPLVVPFAFFVNSQNNLSTYLNATQGLSQGMVEQIISGTISNWDQFFPAMASTPITICLRVAGSGTYATFQDGVLNTNQTGGAALPTTDENIGGTNAWFNNTSADMQKCIGNNVGAIGIADADSGLVNNMSPTGGLPFNGWNATASNIANGLYDRFWTLEHIFETNPAPAGEVGSVVGDLITYLSAGPVPAGEANYWNLATGMKVHKANDFDYPPAAGKYVAGQCYE